MPAEAGYNVAFAEGEFDISVGARLSYNIVRPRHRLRLLRLSAIRAAGGNVSYGEFYAKPSVKVTDWLTIGGAVIGGSNFGNGG